MTDQLLELIPQLGFGGIVFIIWLFDQKKIDSYKALTEKSVEREENMSKMNEQLIHVIEKNTEAFTKFSERLKNTVK